MPGVPTAPKRCSSTAAGPTVVRMYFANAGDNVHAVGSLQPLAPVVGCIVIKPDGTRVLARAVPDPLAQPD